MSYTPAAGGEHTRAVSPPPAAVPAERPMRMPVHRATTYAFDTSQDYADVLSGARQGYSYARIDSPTVDAFAEAVAALEGAGLPDRVRGQAFASGMGALSTVFMALTESGSHVVASRSIYGNTYSLLDRLLRRFGVRTDFVDITDLGAVREAVRPGTAVLFTETLSNPTMTVSDLPGLARIAREAGAALVVDSTFASPAVCRPLEFGADIVVHSATKYLGGHSDTTGGVAVAFAVNQAVPVSVLMSALALGAIATNTGMVGPALRPGLAFAARQMLRTGVVLLGLQLALPDVLALGPGVLTLVVVSAAVTYAGTLAMGRALGLSAERSLLIATGFSICGASAVAAARSVVHSDEEDVASGIALVTIFGTLSVVIMPALYVPLGLDPTSFGIWAGASVHEVAQVVAVAGTVGASALAPAVVVKLTRVVLLAPLVAGMALWQRRAAGVPASGERPPIIPVFVLGFLVAMAVRSADVLPAGLLDVAATAQTMLLAAAMFGMGASVHLRTLVRGGGPGLLLGLLSTLLISTVSVTGLAFL
jgi:uncharacterized integral membrane protein (TIGR00698 family)